MLQICQLARGWLRAGTVGRDDSTHNGEPVLLGEVAEEHVVCHNLAVFRWNFANLLGDPDIEGFELGDVGGGVCFVGITMFGVVRAEGGCDVARPDDHVGGVHPDVRIGGEMLIPAAGEYACGDAFGNCDGCDLRARIGDDGCHEFFKAEADLKDQGSVADRGNIARGRLVGVFIGSGRHQRGHRNQVAANLADHVGEDRGGGDHGYAVRHRRGGGSTG